MKKPTSNAVYGYEKSRTGIGSTRTTQLDVLQKYLCIYFMPKPNLLQRLKMNRRRQHEFY
ncbi:hypothetical protein MUDAN_DOGOELCO_02538 [Lactiplantibacillus mudanjiangensis]|nr:hypothetical protein MUDAN_DOGOELCO_02538 [Lactiplantibacillus mudanjiangensis]